MPGTRRTCNWHFWSSEADSGPCSGPTEIRKCEKRKYAASPVSPRRVAASMSLSAFARYAYFFWKGGAKPKARYTWGGI